MSFKGIIHDMREEIGSISRKGFEVKLGSYGIRSRAHRGAIHDGQSAAAAVDALKQSCWANMPLEILRDVLMRIEDSESTWPLRKNVVACAGVCRSWRDITRDIVKTPEVSGKLTFPISLKQGMKNVKIEDLEVAISNFLGTKFIVYDGMPPHAGAMVTKSRSYRLGSKQVSPRVPAGNYPVAHIAYELNVLGSRYASNSVTIIFFLHAVDLS
ncbi:hypothetical protein Taro_053014 [Colocasia esculenta]|uniref:F-box domain-containing protein n=1 Tax=Colocasia esculenta TaxID=4460 RepID=A0A843XK36_COLES|nr:hypothetical protein [Colocasia esculenta]